MYHHASSFDEIFDQGHGSGMDMFMLGSSSPPPHVSDNDTFHQLFNPVASHGSQLSSLDFSTQTSDPGSGGSNADTDDIVTPGATSPFAHTTPDAFADKFEVACFDDTLFDWDKQSQPEPPQHGEMRLADAPTTAMLLAAGHSGTDAERRRFMSKLTQHFHSIQSSELAAESARQQQHQQLADGGVITLATGIVNKSVYAPAQADVPRATDEDDLVCHSPELSSDRPQQVPQSLSADGAFTTATAEPAQATTTFTSTIGPAESAGAGAEAYASAALVERVHNARLALLQQYEQRAAVAAGDQGRAEQGARREYAMSDDEIAAMITDSAYVALQGNMPSKSQIQLAMQRAASNGLDEILAELDPTSKPAMADILKHFAAQNADGTVRQRTFMQCNVFEPPAQFAPFWTVHDNQVALRYNMLVAGRNESMQLIEHKLFQTSELRTECKAQYEEKVDIEQKLSSADAILRSLTAKQAQQ